MKTSSSSTSRFSCATGEGEDMPEKEFENAVSVLMSEVFTMIWGNLGVIYHDLAGVGVIWRDLPCFGVLWRELA